jgi:hypothetical protein
MMKSSKFAVLKIRNVRSILFNFSIAQNTKCFKLRFCMFVGYINEYMQNYFHFFKTCINDFLCFKNKGNTGTQEAKKISTG